MQDALPIVIVAVVVVAAVIGIVLMAGGKGIYDDIRAGDVRPGPDPGWLADEDLRQLQRAVRRAPDDDLRAEVRALVEARNARLVARGKPPLDVDSEIERRLSELDE